MNELAYYLERYFAKLELQELLAQEEGYSGAYKLELQELLAQEEGYSGAYKSVLRQ